MKLFDQTLRTLERALDVRATKHSVLASNLANVDTPGYRARDVDFDEAMTSALDAEGASAAEREEIWARDLDTRGAGFDGNGVDLDRTMASLSANATQYSAATRAAHKKLALLKYVASDGNG